jgi:hypothetical protein
MNPLLGVIGLIPMPVELMQDYSPLWPAVQPKAQGVQSNAQFPTNRKGGKCGAKNLEQQHEHGRKHMTTSFHKVSSPRFAIIPVGDSVSPLAGSNKGSLPKCDRKNSSAVGVDAPPLFYRSCPR